ncbi:MAG TPA: hypothetical protein VGX51_06155 [Solirubrobacteraceae bacterium]|jgi:hypothetical protein|nr:hypothetical protein [Solirubrobacteraceae bacterium]
MLYIATVHYRSPRWVEIQARQLRRHIAVPHQTWTSLEGIDASYAVHFDRVLEQRGLHAGKLNHLAMEILAVAADDDLLMFLDGDAFPIADPMPLIEDGLARTPLVAVRRAENVDEPQPHPSFCVTTARLWRELPGDWTAGPTWQGARGKPTSDVGANLLRRLQLSGTSWLPVLRSNHLGVDPLYFAVYGGVIYHHGAGFREGELSPADRDNAPTPVSLGRVTLAGPAARAANRWRWRSWERRLRREHTVQSRRIYESIRDDRADWMEQVA